MTANNRFKKSIEKATNNTQESIVDNTAYSTSNSTLENTTENILSKRGDYILKKVLENTKKNKGRNHTIYLSADVGEALVKLVQRSKKSKSTLVDEILREVLLN